MHSHFSSTSSNSIHSKFLLAVLLNVTLAVTQVIYANQAHSVSLLSDALHNLGDVVGLVIAWGAQALATYRASARYTYGYKKLTILASLSNALILMGSVAIILYEAFGNLTHVHQMNEIPVLIVALVGVVINAGTAWLFVKEKESDMNIKAAFLHLVIDALTSLVVILSAVIIYFTGYQWIDSVLALVIALVIFTTSWTLLRRALVLLLDAVPPHVNQNEVTKYLMGIPGVQSIENLHIWAVSTQESALTAHLLMHHGASQEMDYALIQKELVEKFSIQLVTLQRMHRQYI